MNIVVSDWGSLNQVLPIAKKYQVGVEVQEFTQLANLEQATTLAPSILEKVSSIELVGMHAPFSELVPASRDPLIRQVVTTRLQQAYDLAKAIAAKHLIIHSGFLPKSYPREMWIQNSYNFWVEFLIGKDVGNFIHIENVYEDDFSALQELIDRINRAYQQEVLTICLDIGHVNANSSTSLADWIVGLGDRIRYVHLHNNAGQLDDHWRLDKGTINVGEVLELLLKHSPNAVWTVETFVEDIEPSLMWLKQRGYL